MSVGAAPNRLMAKLASAAAKPDGVRLLADRRASLALLAQVGGRGGRSVCKGLRVHATCRSACMRVCRVEAGLPSGTQ